MLFIHIPKCGGDTVSHVLRLHGDAPFLFNGDGSVLVNGHTPQHMTWREFSNAGWTPESGFRVCALVRHPVDRAISAFRYIHASRPHLVPLAQTPSMFLDTFLSGDAALAARLDYHNLSIHAFLQNQEGEIDPAIEIWPLQEMDRFMASMGLPPVDPQDRRNVTRTGVAAGGGAVFGAHDMARIVAHYARDIQWFERRFRDIRSEYAA